MEKIKYYGMIIAMLLAVISFNSCSSDDNNEIPIDSYLKGKWYSYKAVVSANNQSVEVEVSKTNQYSQFYYEADFRDNNQVDMSYYNVENNTSTRWTTETDSYSIKGDVITIYDSKDAIDFFYSPKEKNMYMRIAGNVDGVGWTTIFIYFRK